MEHPALLLVAILLVAIGLFNSWTIEKQLADPHYSPRKYHGKLGTSAPVRQLVRFIYRFSTLIWWGLAFWLMKTAFSPLTHQGRQILVVLHLLFAMMGVVTLVNSRGRELIWPVYFAIAGLLYLSMG